MQPVIIFDDQVNAILTAIICTGICICLCLGLNAHRSSD